MRFINKRRTIEMIWGETASKLANRQHLCFAPTIIDLLGGELVGSKLIYYC